MLRVCACVCVPVCACILDSVDLMVEEGDHDGLVREFHTGKCAVFTLGL